MSIKRFIASQQSTATYYLCNALIFIDNISSLGVFWDDFFFFHNLAEQLITLFKWDL